ncbi:DUF5710 domain-containing protein [Streptomyces sp. NPDC048611]|uniref:DUF5710 domain-containing protein n=1 Tax=Streptomyces sp. NPDC048611 TaxID=3155635 RepID=UPI003421C770
MVRALDGAGFSRSTIYDAFSSTRLPSWEVVDALVEILATKHPQTSPEEAQPRFHEMWLRAVDEESDSDSAEEQLPQLPAPPPLEPPEDMGPDHSGPDDEPLLLSTNSPLGEALANLARADRRKRKRRGRFILDESHPDRVYLDLVYEDRETAREVGALWDREAKRWYFLRRKTIDQIRADHPERP